MFFLICAFFIHTLCGRKFDSECLGGMVDSASVRNLAFYRDREVDCFLSDFTARQQLQCRGDNDACGALKMLACARLDANHDWHCELPSETRFVAYYMEAVNVTCSEYVFKNGEIKTHPHSCALTFELRRIVPKPTTGPEAGDPIASALGVELVTQLKTCGRYFTRFFVHHIETWTVFIVTDQPPTKVFEWLCLDLWTSLDDLVLFYQEVLRLSITILDLVRLVLH